MESIIATFHIDWKIIIAQAINFGVVFTVLYVFALKPLSKLMEERAQKISKGVDDAKTNAETLKATKTEYDKVLAEARVEANTIFQNTKKEAEIKRVEMLDLAKKDVDTMIENGKKTLEAQKTKMVEEAKTEIVSLVTQATEKLLITKADHHFDNQTAGEIKKFEK